MLWVKHPYSNFWKHKKYAPVAQLDRAPDYGSGGQGFESSRARHLNQAFNWFHLFKQLIQVTNKSPL